jgi:hypothetical protein
VDDAQWADMDSLRALLFTARRLVDQRMLMVFGERIQDAHRLPAGLHRLAGGRTGTTVLLNGQVWRAAARCPRTHCPRRRPRRPGSVRGRRADLHDAGAAIASTPAATRPRRSSKALAVLGTATPAAAGILAGVPDLTVALSEASSAELLQVRGDFGIRSVTFPHPLVPAAVYERLGLRPPDAAALGRDRVRRRERGAGLRRRLLVATAADPRLAAELEAFARREIASGAWGARGVGPWSRAARLCPESEPWPQRLLRTVERHDRRRRPAVTRSSVTSRCPPPPCGGTPSAATGPCCVADAPKPKNCWATRGDTARKHGHPGTGGSGATVAQRMTCTSWGKLRGRRRGALVSASQSRWPIPATRPREEAETLLGLGLAWQGRIDEGIATLRNRC